MPFLSNKLRTFIEATDKIPRLSTKKSIPEQ